MAEAVLEAWVIGLAGFLLLWPISLMRRDTSIVDFWWGPGFGAIAIYAWVVAGMPTHERAVLILGLVVLWSARLGLQLGRRRLREGEEDPRYQEIRAAWDPGFWWKSLFIVFVSQAILQFLVAAGPLSGAFAEAQPLAILGVAGLVLALAGLVIETVSDVQLDRFRRTTPHGGLLETGLRRYVRFPSYTGEMMIWWGLAAIAFEAGVYWAPLSAALLTFLLLRLSGVSVLDDRLERTRPGYAAYRARVPALFPDTRALGALFQRGT